MEKATYVIICKTNGHVYGTLSGSEDAILYLSHIPDKDNYYAAKVERIEIPREMQEKGIKCD